VKIAYSFFRARTASQHAIIRWQILRTIPFRATCSPRNAGISSIRARAVSVIYPLHTGELGGPLLMTVLGVGGLALFGLSVTGVRQWWRRRKARRVPSGTRNR
jgi:hypothetical protein